MLIDRIVLIKYWFWSSDEGQEQRFRRASTIDQALETHRWIGKRSKWGEYSAAPKTRCSLPRTLSIAVECG